MSKHFHNYNKQYNNNKPVEPAVEEVTVATSEAVVEENTVYGTVECKDMLNVRKAPKADAAIACMIKNGSEVIVDVTNSTDDFYKICTEAGLEGYCMKKFIKVD